MATPIESVASGQSPIDKPTGLSVGDLMVAVVGGQNTTTPTTPTGWTALISHGFSPYSNGIFYKVADGDDVAATDFTFQSDSQDMFGAIYRISDYVLDSDVSYQEFLNTDTSGFNPASVATGITPVSSSAIFIAGYHVWENGLGTASLDAKDLSNVTTSFTERYEGAPQSDTKFAVADTVISSKTALGNATVVVGGTVDQSDINQIGIFGIIIHERVDVTATPDTLTTNAEVFKTAPQLFVNSNNLLYSPTVTVIPAEDLDVVWTNETPPSTNWTNDS